MEYVAAATAGPGRWDVVINKRGISYRDAATIYVEIHETDPADPIRKLRFMHTGHLAMYETAPFEPLLVARMAGMTPVRFMDWGNTNRQRLSAWADRPKPSTYSQATNKGVALEHMIALVNATKADAWINVPHLANDAFVREMAKMLLAQLHPAGKVYVEYSNETWNTEFDQGKYVSTESKVKYPGLRADLAHQKFATYKQVHVWELFKEVFGAQFEARIRRPLGGQAASMSVNKARLDYAEASDVNPQGIKVQGLALAPYFGKVYRNSDVAGGIPTTAQLLQDAKSDITQRRSGVWASAKQLANQEGVKLWAVEAGQTIRAVESVPRESQVFVDNAFAANRSPQMLALYREYLQALVDSGFELTIHFVFCGGWSKFGTWGAIESLDQPNAEAPKHQALLEALFGN